MNREVYVLLGGWTRLESSYKRLLRTAPNDVEVFVLPHIMLDIHGEKNELNKNILDFLETNNLEKVILVGHSLGGALAMKFTHDHPERVKKLILVDAEGVYVQQSIVSTALHTFVNNVFIYAKAKWWENRKSMLRILLRPIVYTKSGLFAHKVDVQEEAKEIHVPTIILWGAKDIMLPVSQGETLHKLIKNSKLTVLPHMDHDWLLHRPDLFWKNTA